MSEPILDRVAKYFGEGPLLRRVREIARRVRAGYRKSSEDSRIINKSSRC